MKGVPQDATDTRNSTRILTQGRGRVLVMLSRVQQPFCANGTMRMCVRVLRPYTEQVVMANEGADKKGDDESANACWMCLFNCCTKFLIQ